MDSGVGNFPNIVLKAFIQAFQQIEIQDLPDHAYDHLKERLDLALEYYNKCSDAIAVAKHAVSDLTSSTVLPEHTTETYIDSLMDSTPGSWKAFVNSTNLNMRTDAFKVFHYMKSDKRKQMLARTSSLALIGGFYRHAMSFVFEAKQSSQQESTRYTIYIINSGLGVETYHKMEQDPNMTPTTTRRGYEVIYRLPGQYTKQQRDHVIDIVHVQNFMIHSSPRSLYETIFRALGLDVNTLEKKIDKKAISSQDDWRFIYPQQSGSCTYFSILYLFKCLFYLQEGTSSASFAEFHSKLLKRTVSDLVNEGFASKTEQIAFANGILKYLSEAELCDPLNWQWNADMLSLFNFTNHMFRWEWKPLDTTPRVTDQNSSSSSSSQNTTKTVVETPQVLQLLPTSSILEAVRFVEEANQRDLGSNHGLTVIISLLRFMPYLWTKVLGLASSDISEFYLLRLAQEINLNVKQYWSSSVRWHLSLNIMGMIIALDPKRFDLSTEGIEVSDEAILTFLMYHAYDDAFYFGPDVRVLKCILPFMTTFDEREAKRNRSALVFRDRFSKYPMMNLLDRIQYGRSLSDTIDLYGDTDQMFLPFEILHQANPLLVRERDELTKEPQTIAIHELFETGRLRFSSFLDHTDNKGKNRKTVNGLPVPSINLSFQTSFMKDNDTEEKKVTEERVAFQRAEQITKELEQYAQFHLPLEEDACWTFPSMFRIFLVCIQWPLPELTARVRKAAQQPNRKEWLETLNTQIGRMMLDWMIPDPKRPIPLPSASIKNRSRPELYLYQMYLRYCLQTNDSRFTLEAIQSATAVHPSEQHPSEQHPSEQHPSEHANPSRTKQNDPYTKPNKQGVRTFIHKGKHYTYINDTPYLKAEHPFFQEGLDTIHWFRRKDKPYKWIGMFDSQIRFLQEYPETKHSERLVLSLDQNTYKAMLHIYRLSRTSESPELKETLGYVWLGRTQGQRLIPIRFADWSAANTFVVYRSFTDPWSYSLVILRPMKLNASEYATSSIQYHPFWKGSRQKTIASDYRGQSIEIWNESMKWPSFQIVPIHWTGAQLLTDSYDQELLVGMFLLDGTQTNNINLLVQDAACCMLQRSLPTKLPKTSNLLSLKEYIFGPFDPLQGTSDSSQGAMRMYVNPNRENVHLSGHIRVREFLKNTLQTFNKAAGGYDHFSWSPNHQVKLLYVPKKGQVENVLKLIQNQLILQLANHVGVHPFFTKFDHLLEQREVFYTVLGLRHWETCYQQILHYLRSRAAQTQNEDGDDTFDEKDREAVQAIVHRIWSQTYMGSRSKLMVIFECLFGSLLRNDQAEWILEHLVKPFEKGCEMVEQEDSSFRYQVQQLLMGRGKTSVAIPFMCLYSFLYPKQDIYTSYVVMPNHLIPATKAQYHRLFGTVLPSLRIYNVSTTSELQAYSSERMKHLDLPQVSLVFMNEATVKEFAYRNSDEPFLMYNSLFVFDEMDSLLKPSTSSLNLIDTSETKQMEWIPQLTTVTYSLARTYQRLYQFKPLSSSEEALRRAKETLLQSMDSKVQTYLRQWLDEYDKLQSSATNKVAWNTYLHSVVDWTSERIASTLPLPHTSWWILIQCTILLPRAIEMVHSKHYGFGHEENNVTVTKTQWALHAVPYRDLHQPLNDSSFEDPILNALLTCFCYARAGGLRALDMEWLIMESVRRYAFQLPGLLTRGTRCRTIQDLRNAESEFFKNGRSVFQRRFLLNVGPSIPFSDTEAMTSYLETVVFPILFRMAPRMIPLSMLDAIHGSITRIKCAFSGTIYHNWMPAWDASQTNEFGPMKPDETIHKQIRSTILGSDPSNQRLIRLEGSTPESILSSIPSTYQALIDVGGYFKDIENHVVVQLWEKALEGKENSNTTMERKTNMNTFFVWIDPTLHRPVKRQMGSVSDQTPERFEADDLQRYPPELGHRWYYYYDHGHLIGTDIAQPDRLAGLATISYFNQLTDTAQAVYRLRKLGPGFQTINFAVHSMYCSDLMSSTSTPKTRAELFEWLEQQELRINNEQEPLFCLQSLRTFHRIKHQFKPSTFQEKQILYQDRGLAMFQPPDPLSRYKNAGTSEEKTEATKECLKRITQAKFSIQTVRHLTQSKDLQARNIELSSSMDTRIQPDALHGLHARTVQLALYSGSTSKQKDKGQVQVLVKDVFEPLNVHVSKGWMRSWNSNPNTNSSLIQTQLRHRPHFLLSKRIAQLIIDESDYFMIMHQTSSADEWNDLSLVSYHNEALRPLAMILCQPLGDLRYGFFKMEKRLIEQVRSNLQLQDPEPWFLLGLQTTSMKYLYPDAFQLSSKDVNEHIESLIQERYKSKVVVRPMEQETPHVSGKETGSSTK